MVPRGVDSFFPGSARVSGGMVRRGGMRRPWRRAQARRRNRQAKGVLMRSTGLAAGTIIEAKCTRCNDITGHVIVAMVGGEVVKVECRACGSVHKYRPQKQDVPRGAAPSVRKVRAGSTRAEAVDVSASRSEAARKAAATRAQQRAARDAEATEVAWKVAMTRNPAETNRKYSMNEGYEEGEIIDHPVFGPGLVRAVVRPDKVEVLFQEGLKVLRCVC